MLKTECLSRFIIRTWNQFIRSTKHNNIQYEIDIKNKRTVGLTVTTVSHENAIIYHI